MESSILEKLKAIEVEKDIDILFAVESGSRAWGFPSPDSDYDIRFVYRHNKDWYLNLWEQKDTIQFMTEEDLDGSGWDLRKALKLLAKSNASFLGWLFSPIVYKADETFFNDLKVLAEKSFNPIAGFYHYHNMNKNFEASLGKSEMTLKSFFYTIRTALCANWIYKKGTIPPVQFKKLYELVSSDFSSDLEKLVFLKSNSKEKSNESVAPYLINEVKAIIAENNRIKDSLKAGKCSSEDFNEFFLKYLKL